MRRLIDVVAAYALLAALIAAAFHLTREPPRSLDGRAYAIDGDTLVMRGEHMRLIGIDAPELDQICHVGGASVACGRLAREALSAMLGEVLRCEGHGHDRYRRSLVICRTDKGDVATRLVTAGQAVASGCCAVEEQEARAAGRGLWAGTFERPADWRRRKRNSDAGS